MVILKELKLDDDEDNDSKHTHTKHFSGLETKLTNVSRNANNPFQVKKLGIKFGNLHRKIKAHKLTIK